MEMQMGVQMENKKKRRSFSSEFRSEAIRLASESGKSVAQIARDIGVHQSSLHLWVRQAKIDRGEGPAGAPTTEELEELRHLRKEVRELRMERDFLKKTAAYFAKVTK
jgi:transposase